MSFDVEMRHYMWFVVYRKCVREQCYCPHQRIFIDVFVDVMTQLLRRRTWSCKKKKKKKSAADCYVVDL